jgi:hypothetical protein
MNLMRVLFYLFPILLMTSCVPENGQGIGQAAFCGKTGKSLNLSHAQHISCAQLDKIVCDIREFSPDVTNQQKVEQYCQDSSDNCATININQFSTADVKENDQLAGPEDFEPGGTYNYKEV